MCSGLCGIAALLGVSGPAQAQSSRFEVRIVSVECLETTLGPGRDDLYLTFSNGRRLPKRSVDSIKMDSGDVWNPNYRVSARGTLQITLMEYDELVDDDVIGSIVVDSDEDDDRYVERVSGHGGKYEVTYEISHRR